MQIYVSANIFKTLGVILDAVNLCNIQQRTVASYWLIHLYIYLAKSLHSLWLKSVSFTSTKMFIMWFSLLVCLTLNSLVTRCFYAVIAMTPSTPEKEKNLSGVVESVPLDLFRSQMDKALTNLI